MITSYLRSSSYNNWDVCQQQYFINYVLGVPRGANLKADKGTIVHKILEILAVAKMYIDKNPHLETISFAEDIGDIKFNRDEFLTPYVLSDKEVDSINKSRKDKKVYISDATINYGHTRFGVDLVDYLIQRVFNYYSIKNTQHNWTNTDYKDCENFTWMALDCNNGEYDPRRRNIVHPEYGFDFAIDTEWAKYKHNGIESQLRIKGTIDLVTQIDDNTYEIVDWKGLPVDTLLPTPNGWSTMGEIEIGDTLFDKDGCKTKVLAKSKKNYKNCYKIYFDDTTNVICDNEHLWLLNNNKTVNVKELKVGDKICVTKPIESDYKKLPIDPYILGIWLGDGRNRCGEISNADEFIFEEIKRRGYNLGKNISCKQEICQQRTIYGIRKELRKLNLLNNKHIPSIYLRASISQRLDLLRGLMDSDGSVNIVRKQAVFTNCNKKLSDDTKELLLSLGQRPNQANINHKYKDDICKVYPLHFRPININPFLLPRKANKILQNWGPGQSNIRRIEKIELLPIELETQCIMVDSPSNTYLCTENMIPTHNTGKRQDFASGEKKDYKKLQTDPQLMLYYYAAKHLFPSVDEIVLTIFFVRHGGPFTITFCNNDLHKMEKLLKNRVEEIWNCKTPKLVSESQTSFKCTYLCDYYKNNWPNTNTNICKFIQKQTKELGIDEVTKKYTWEGHSFDKYKSPGE